MKKFMITGFSGFVSRHFLEYLENHHVESLVKGLDISYPEFEQGNFRSVKFEFERLDLLDKEKVENILYEFQPDYILHLASYSSVAFSWEAPIISFQNNTNIYLNLLEGVRKFNLPVRILSIGSSEEYGNIEKKDLPVTEEHSLKPGSPYAVARVAQELLSQIYTNGYGLDIVMTRSFNHIGPFQKDIFVVPSFVKQLVEIKKKKGSGKLVAGDLEIVRDFTDVRDAVSAYYLLLTQGKKGEIYNVCSGKGFSLKQIIDKICNILNIDINIHLDSRLLRPNENRIIIGSSEKLKTNYAWELKYTIENSLDDMIRYWQSQN
ncbi:MAG: GDP-mannose 4,6-dehydratase [Syntrophales bacterium]